MIYKVRESPQKCGGGSNSFEIDLRLRSPYILLLTYVYMLTADPIQFIRGNSSLAPNFVKMDTSLPI